MPSQKSVGEPRDQVHWVCDGCGREADWAPLKKFCGACKGRERTAWLFAPVRASGTGGETRAA